eukprot:Phypoly_transcript_17102.p1 GENE.Phypoly_transcript_17102~~Phypoly_transcript_17102.p1  ORF type:complete len:236 (+),score=37.47 Phypoly_transcript_17102:49-756(+)
MINIVVSHLVHDDWHRSNKTKEEKFQKPFIFQSGNRQITIEQRPVVIENMNTLGFTVWDASLVFAKYVEKESNFSYGFWKGKRVLTLGSGTGIDSIVLSLLGAEVVATDLEVGLLAKNISSNVDDLSKVRVEELCWGNEQHLQKFAKEPPFDFIVACDCIYFPDLIPLLIKTLSTLASPTTQVIVASEGHFVQVLEMFLQQAGQEFNIKQVGDEEMDTQYKGSEFFIWHFNKKSQ